MQGVRNGQGNGGVRLTLSLCFALWLWAAPWAGCGVDSAEEDIAHASAVVAVVNGKAVTFGTVWKRVGRVLERAKTVLPEAEFQRYAKKQLLLTLQDYIDRELLLAKAQEEGITVTEAQVERFAEQEMAYLNQQGENLTTLEDYFKAIEEETGMTEKEYREELRARVAIGRYLRQYVWKPEYFAPTVVRRWWEEHREEFREGGYVEVRHVYVQREHPEYYRIVEEVRRAAAQGRFDEIARRAVAEGWSHRRGRDGAGLFRYLVGETASGEAAADGSLKDLWEPLAAAIRQLGVGQVSAPLQSPAGTHFVKLVGRGGGRIRSFSEVQQEIQRRLRKDLEERVKRAFLKKLLAQADIRRFPFPEQTPAGRINWQSAGAQTDSAVSKAAKQNAEGDSP